MHPRRGIIFFAVGSQYVDAAVNAAVRSASFNSVPHYIYASEHREIAHANIHIISYSPSGDTYKKLDRIRMLMPEFLDEIIYLDSDCGVLSDITDMFDILKVYDIAAAHAPGYRGMDDRLVPPAFYELNTGVMVYRNNDKIHGLFDLWAQHLEGWSANPPFAGATPMDQPPFRRALWEKQVPIYILGPEYNWRPWMNSFLCGRAKIAQTYSLDYDGLDKIANQDLGARVFPPIAAAHKEIDTLQII